MKKNFIFYNIISLMLVFVLVFVVSYYCCRYWIWIEPS